jgi:hypothetical protein
MKFLIIDGDLLSSPEISASGKLIISYIRYVESYNKSAWGSCSYVASVLGLSENVVIDEINCLQKENIIIQDAQTLRFVLDERTIKVWRKLKPNENPSVPVPESDKEGPIKLLKTLEVQKELALQKGHIVEEFDGERLFMRTQEGSRYVILKGQSL